MGKPTISMAIFNSYFDITRGYPVSAGGLASSSRIWRSSLGPETEKTMGIFLDVSKGKHDVTTTLP